MIIRNIQYKSLKPKKQNTDNTIQSKSTAVVSFEDENSNTFTKIYNVIQADKIYDAIASSEIINVSNCLVEILSIRDYKNKYAIDRLEMVKIKGLIAKNTIFANRLELGSVIFESEVDFSHSFFEDGVDCSGSEFNHKFTLWNSKHKSLSIFSYSKFNQVIVLSKSSFNQGVAFNGSHFKGSCWLNDINIANKTNLQNCKFFDSISIKNTVFNGDFDFSRSSVKSNLNCLNSIFKRKADFNNCQFQSKVCFNEVFFDGQTNFEKAWFSSYTEFKSITFNNSVVFKWSLFLKQIDFSNSIFMGTTYWKLMGEYELLQSVNLILADAYFKYPANFTKHKFKKLNLESCVFEKNGIFKNCSIDLASRETYRIIKHEFLKTNNRLDAAIYFKREMEERNKELEIPKLEKYLLKAYGLINEYGTNMTRATIVLGTPLIIILPLLLIFGFNNSYIDWSWGGFYNYFKVCTESFDYTLTILNPTHKTSDINGGDFNTLGSLIHTALRIYIPIMLFFVLQPLKKFKSW